MFLNKNWIVDEAIGGWQLSSTIVLQSGVPFTVTATDTSNSLAGNGFVQYPNLIGNPKLANPSIHHWFNEAAFAPAAPYTFGDERRNNLFGPNLQQVDASLGKSFHIWESAQLQIRADATNVINHPGFGNPATGLATAKDSTTTFGTGSSTITSTSVGGRTIQLGARLSF
jgi:hypothetical protein